MTRQYLNVPTTTLNGGINASVTSLTVASASTFPTVGNFNILVDSGSNAEIMQVTAVSGTTFTVVRASETYPGGAVAGTGVSHLTGVAISLVVTAGDLATYNHLGSVAADTPITGAISLTSTSYNTRSICSGTSANYAVTLPDATVAPVGTVLGFRMSSALTKLVTLTSATGTQLDGAATRIMWANETCTLQSDGAQWRKIDGRVIPMQGDMTLSTNPSIPSATLTQLLLDTTTLDNTGLMCSTGTSLISILRPGNYLVSGAVAWNNVGVASTYRFRTQVMLTNTSGTQVSAGEQMPAVTGFNGVVNTPTRPFAFTAGQVLLVCAYQSTGGSCAAYGGGSSLSVVEIPTW